MKTKWWWGGFLVLILCAGINLHAQQSGETFAATKAKAEQGDAAAQLHLGQMYYDGRGVTKDEVEAAKWYRKAAEQNVAVAQCNLGFCYNGGQGISQDYGEAVKGFARPL